MQRAINKNRNQGLPTDYQSLGLPAETKNYVPKLQAIKNIITNPDKFGIKLGSIPNKPYFARVTMPKQIDAKLAAQFAEITLEEFSALNPSYNRPVITSQSEKHQLLLPVWAAERFIENLAGYDKPLTNWQTYNAKRGERMENIAQKFGIDVSQLRHVNSLSSAKQLRNAQPVLVPANYSLNEQASSIKAIEMENNNTIAAEEDKDKTIIVKSQQKQASPVTYKVKRGDTLQSLARKYETSTKELMQFNQLKTNKVFAGQLIKINKTASDEKYSKLSKNKRMDKTTVIKSGKTKNDKITSRIVKIKSKNLKTTRLKTKFKT